MDNNFFSEDANSVKLANCHSQELNAKNYTLCKVSGVVIFLVAVPCLKEIDEPYVMTP